MVDPPPLVRPVAGPVASWFAYDRAAPFRRGARRVVRFRVPPGTVVRSPCPGRVSHAGPTPGGPAVSLRCGAWSATLTGTIPAGARRGQRARPGQRVGRARGGTVGLGLRRAADPFGYVDPLPLLGDPVPARRFAPLGPAPSTRPRAPAPARAPRTPVPRPLARPRSVPAPAPVGAPAADPGPVVRPADEPAAPLVAWVGLAVAAAGLPAGVVGLRLRRRRLGVRPIAEPGVGS